MDVSHVLDLDAEMVDGARLSAAFEQDQLQWRVLDGEVRISGLHLVDGGAKHLFVEADRLIEVVDVEGKLQSHEFIL